MAHVTLLSLGTRGDLMPLGLLGGALQARGHDVVFLTIPDYQDYVRSFGIDAATVGGELDTLLMSEPFQRILSGRFAPGAAAACLRALRPALHAILEDVWRKTPQTDLIVHNPIAFYGGHLARERGIPSMRVMCQPLMPSWRQSYSLLLGGRNLGGPLNRVSYEINRLAPALLRMGEPIAGTRRFGSWVNPVSDGMAGSEQILAASPVLCADPGDWGVPVNVTGFWFPRPAANEAVPAALATFLAKGPPPLYIGFGSMNWGAQSVTQRVLEAVRLWGGRAVLGAGGLVPGDDLPTNVFAAGDMPHALLFPHVAAVVHHGGAGSTAMGLLHARPTQILPVLGDQMYWGKRVAATGAGPPPIPLHRAKPDELARRFALLTGNAGFGAAAARIGAALAGDPGLSAGVAAAEALLQGA